jgi:hypothetical protein
MTDTVLVAIVHTDVVKDENVTVRLDVAVADTIKEVAP